MLPETDDLETEVTHAFHWHITDWKALEPRCHSPVSMAGNFPWRILLFPKGNNQNNAISLYLEVADSDAQKLPEDWHVCAQFMLAISDPNDPTVFFTNAANHRFSATDVDWGFTRFYEIKNLTQGVNGKGPFLINNQMDISFFIRIVKDDTGVLWHNFVNYDSRKETGYVGIKNQGATCYMNSLLQSLYCTNQFRKAVYQIPTEKDEPTKSVALALQRCFYNLQSSKLPVDTTELTKSFGWDSLEAFMQHDVQEFNRVLQDNLELKMKGTPADGAISKLFLGKMKSYIKCINVDYESSRTEDYYDIQLNVRGCKSLYDSFKDYVTVETLEGENKYMAEGYGLQDAQKGVIFESFPPVLHLQLKRFEYDFMKDTMIKINDRHEFPNEINLDEFASSNAKEDGPNTYVLHGVLVHSGDVHGGHYFTLIKPAKDAAWLRFDDDRVTKVTEKEVFEENYGDEPHRTPGAMNGAPPFLNPAMKTSSFRMMRKFTNAYMLVYIRKSKVDEILGPVLEDDIPLHLKERLNEERAAVERRKKDREEMHLYAKVAVVTDATFANRQEFDIAMFDDRRLETSPEVDIFKVPRTEKIVVFKQKIIEHYKINPEKFRLWTIAYRSNETARVDRPLTPTEERMSFDKLREAMNGYNHLGGFAKLYLEISDFKLSNHVKPGYSIVFLKYFEVKEQKMRGLGKLYVKDNDKIGDIIPQLVEKAGLEKSTPISLYEEIRPSRVDLLKTKQTFSAADIQHGDILCFQMALSEEEAKRLREEGRYATVPEYFNALYNRVMVLFKPRFDKNAREEKMVLSRRTTYIRTAENLAKILNVDAGKLRFSTAHSVTGQPKEALSYQPRATLEELIPSMPSASEYAHAVSLESIPPPVLYYEVMDISIADLETKRSMKLTVYGPTLRDESTITVLVPKSGIVCDLATATEAKCKSNNTQADRVRFYEAIDGKISKEFTSDQGIDQLGDKRATLYAERLTQDELDMDIDNDRLIQVVHYNKDPARFHGIPFRFIVKKNEPFIETKKRLQKRCGMSDKEWAKVKFSLLKNVNALDPEVIPIEKDDFDLRQSKFGDEDALGLDHVDKTSRGVRFGGLLERGIFIRG
ncbi:uncharacterized protein BYT42DRAFT_493907 [Radiomyces spectabilis]|uniref:uncharacterized protein n=1 Tax=Radiomyces spectabilis TaxID=64574 RepID=UPI002221019D|nr:uncharacterized protein BYT42DRAFT_493907 [Radiomyces spectabilis]KAI8384621.1 hypothetical protein BYT42DRAFT_493907 [Radiomyces spectabilis]